MKVFCVFLLTTISIFIGLIPMSAFAFTTCVVDHPVQNVINLDNVSMYSDPNEDHATYVVHFPVALSIPNPCGRESDPANFLFPIIERNLIADSEGRVTTGINGVRVKYFLHSDKMEFIDTLFNLNPINEKLLSFGENSTDGMWGPVALTVLIRNATMMIDIDHKTQKNTDIDFSTFPHIIIAIHNGQVDLGNTPLMEFSFTGKVHLVQASCTTPNYNYDLGEHSIKQFNGVNSGTNWVDTPVQLNNCNFANANAQANKYYTNTVNLTLTPDTSWLDQTHGIISTTKGTSMASGVGIQLGEKLPSGTYAPHNGFEPLKVMPKANTSGSIIFPLAAHYIQTESQLQQGNANAALTYTIDYQ
ncbi:Fimbrial protein [compost metagenome]